MSDANVEQLSFVEGMTEGMTEAAEAVKPSFPAGEPRKMESIEGYRLVPDSFFPSTTDYLFTIDTRRSYANTACVKFFPDAEYVQYLINAETRMFALKPCGPTDHHSFRWSREKNGKKIPRNRCGKDFAILISTLMGWSPDDRFQFRGSPVPVLIDGKEEMVLSFDLEYNRPYQRKKTEDGKERIVPADMSWLNRLGPLYTEQSRSLKINSINGYNVISTEKKADQQDTADILTEGTEPVSTGALMEGETTGSTGALMEGMESINDAQMDEVQEARDYERKGETGAENTAADVALDVENETVVNEAVELGGGDIDGLRNETG